MRVRVGSAHGDGRRRSQGIEDDGGPSERALMHALMQPRVTQALMRGLDHVAAAPGGSAAALRQQSKVPGGGGHGHFGLGRWAWGGGDGMVVSMVKSSAGAQTQAQCGFAAGAAAVMLASWVSDVRTEV